MSEQVPDPVVVVGDLMLDEAWFGRRDRICPDGRPGVSQRRESDLGGGPWPECWLFWECPFKWWEWLVMTPPVARCWGCFKNMALVLTGWWWTPIVPPP